MHPRFVFEMGLSERQTYSLLLYISKVIRFHRRNHR